MEKIKSVRRQVYEHVLHMIRTNELKFGDKVNIAELQTQLGVSRPPINEALIQLASDGILDNISRKGFFVKQLSEEKTQNIYEVITALDIYVVEKVMRRATEKDIDTLRMIISKIDGAIAKKDFDEYYELQDNFHRIYLEMCGNSVMIETMEDLRRQVIKTTVFSEDTEKLFEYFKLSNQDHEKIVDHIEKKDMNGVKELIIEHNYRKLNM